MPQPHAENNIEITEPDEKNVPTPDGASVVDTNSYGESNRNTS